MVLGSLAARAQTYVVIDSEKIFTSIPAYTSAMTLIDSLSQEYQQKVDAAYTYIEQLYNTYQTQKGYLSDATRKTKEEDIISREKSVEKYQKDVFGPEGEVMKKRLEMIKPIQDKVFKVIENYAQTKGYLLVIDLASNPSVIYYAPAANKTDEIINLTKNIKF